MVGVEAFWSDVSARCRVLKFREMGSATEDMIDKTRPNAVLDLRLCLLPWIHRHLQCSCVHHEVQEVTLEHTEAYL